MGSYALNRLQAADAKRKAKEEKKNETVTAIDTATSETLKSNMQAKKDAAEAAKIDQSGLKKKSFQYKKEREEFSDVADFPSEAKIRADVARKQLEMYKNSDEKRRNDEKRLQDKYAQQLLYGITDSSEVLYDEDPRGKELQAEADYWDNKVKQEADEKLFASNMQEIQNLSGAERTAFEIYANNRTFVDPENLEAFKKLKERYGDKLQDLKVTYQRNKDEQAARTMAEKTAAKVEQGGVLANIGRNILSVGAKLGWGVTGTAGRINELFNGTGPYETAAKYTAGDILGVYGQTVLGKTTEQILGGQEMNLGDGISGRELGALAYQGGMGALDSGARLVAAGGNPFVAVGLAASQTFSSTVQEATENGATPQQAYALAVTNAGIEALTEKLSLGNLMKIAKGGANPKVIVNLLLQAGVEISEEEASLIGTTLAEAAILREKSDYQQTIRKATAMGVPYEQAVAEADRALLEEAMQTALVSGFSGFLSAGGAEGRNRLLGGSQSQQDSAQQPAAVQQTPVQTEQAAQPVQTAPAAEKAVDFVAETARQQAQMVPMEVKEPMPEGLQHFDNAAAIANGLEPVQQQADTQNGVQMSASNTQEQSAEGGQIRGTGAAETGFTPKQAMINEYGNIPEGENPVRPDQFPRSTDGNDRVSYTARTAAEARVTPDEFVPLIEHEVVNRGFSFIPITNDETVRNVTQRISHDGWQTSRANWTAQVRAGVTSPEITATGALLYNHAVNAGDTQEAMNILMDYQMAVRNSARSLQAARILKTLTPSDRLWMIRRSVDAMVQDMNLETPVTINESLAQSYQNAGTQEEADALLDQIAEDVARQIPATRMEAFTALRYLNMLGNFRTQARNVLGNVGSKLVYGLKDKIGAGVETIASAVTGGRVERTKAFATDRSTRQAAARDYEQVREWVMRNGHYNDRQTESDDFARRVQERRQMLPRGLEEARRLTEWAMNTGDEIFARDAYARALAGYLNERGIRTDNLETVDTSLMDRAREYAVRQAQEQTFRDNNQVSDFVSGIMRGRNTPTWARVIGEGVMPFRRTPANVLVRAEEFSPLGIINSAVNTVRAARGNISGEELIDSWAKSLTGTALTAMGWALYGMGVLSGGPDDDEYAEAYNQMNGDQNYAIRLKVGDREYTYTIDWATPAAMPMFLGAQLKKAFDNTADFDWADAEKVLTSIGDPLIQMSMLQGINDTLDSIKCSDNSMGQFLINSIVSYVMQGISNTLLGQLEKSTEGERTMTYVDKDSATPEWLQKQLGKLSQKVPGWDYQQTEYINAKGETEKQPTGLSGVLYNMLSPGYAKEVHTDAVTEEMNRLNNANIEGNVFPSAPDKTLTWTDKAGTVHKDYNLTPEEYQTMATTQGQTAERIKGEIIQSTAYKAMTDQQKADVMDTIDRYAGEAGKAAALKDYDGMENWMKDITPENAVQTFIRKSVDDSMTGAFSDVVDDWSRGTDTTQSVEALDAAYQNYQAMSPQDRTAFIENASGRVKYFIDSKKDGMSTETFTEMYRQYRDIDGKDLSVKDKAQEWSYALEKAVDSGTITERQKDTMKGNMQFRYSFAAETEKFDEMIETGVPTDVADMVIYTINNVQGTGKDGKVQEIDKCGAIANLEGIDDATKDAIMHAYMTDYDPNAEKKEYTELKYDYIRYGLGLSPEEYAETYRAHLDNSNKDAKIAAIMKLGYDEQTATALYDVYKSNTKGKNAYLGYYNTH